MGARRQAREAALQTIFMCDFSKKWDMEEVDFCLEHFSIPKLARPYAHDLVKGIFDNLTKIDSLITCASDHWSIGRMGRVDRSILRLAAYEIAFCDEVPASVAINEAIEISKRFGSPDTPTFVNGVVDRVASRVRSKLPEELLKDVEDAA